MWRWRNDGRLVGVLDARGYFLDYIPEPQFNERFAIIHFFPLDPIGTLEVIFVELGPGVNQETRIDINIPITLPLALQMQFAVTIVLRELGPPVLAQNPTAFQNRPRSAPLAVFTTRQAIFQNQRTYAVYINGYMVNQNRPRAPSPAGVNNPQDIQNWPRAPPAPDISNELAPAHVVNNNEQVVIENQAVSPTPIVNDNDQVADSYTPLQLIDLMFNKYADTSCDRIGSEGVKTLSTDLGIDYTDIKMLILAWKMNAARHEDFTREEWQRGLTTLEADTITKLSSQLTQIESMVNDTSDFMDFYIFAFNYFLEDDQDTLHVSNACQLLGCILGDRYPDHVEIFTDFVFIHEEYMRLTENQWKYFLRFCLEINFPSLDNYVLGHEWPAILDTFVEWMRVRLLV